MSDQQQQQQQPGIILAANRRVPIPNSKYDDAEDKEKEDAEDEKLVQPSKILIPQDGQQPKKWRLADQRR